MNDPVTIAAVQRLIETGREYDRTSDEYEHGIRSTPTMIINNRLVIGTFPDAQMRALFQALIDEAEEGDRRIPRELGRLTAARRSPRNVRRRRTQRPAPDPALRSHVVRSSSNTLWINGLSVPRGGLHAGSLRAASIADPVRRPTGPGCVPAFCLPGHLV